LLPFRGDDAGGQAVECNQTCERQATRHIPIKMFTDREAAIRWLTS
jgi:hypothetical protein